MNTELETKMIEISEKNNQKVSQTFDDFIEMSFQYATTGKIEIKYKDFEDDWEELGAIHCKTVYSKPFYDHLGFLMHSLGITNSNQGVFYTPSELSDCVNRMLMPCSKSSKEFVDMCSGTGSLTLSSMLNRVNNTTYDNDCFTLIDTDLQACKIAFLQVLIAHRILGRELPKLEIICGDALFTEKNHIFVYSNNRDFFDIPIVRRYELYQDDIKIYQDGVRRNELAGKLLEFMHNAEKSGSDDEAA
mgnify:CR=1 FL=1|tara:strand:- start:2368 stop:3105 length:738 start_codon:yes stop_codon:yes gene_type:complete